MENKKKYLGDMGVRSHNDRRQKKYINPQPFFTYPLTNSLPHIKKKTKIKMFLV